MSTVPQRAFPRTSVLWNRQFVGRLIPLAIVLLSLFGLRCLREYASIRFANESFLTGYGLSAVVIALTALGIRKQLPTWALGRAALWQRAHHYLGMASVGMYTLHAKWITTGWLESFLAIAFWCIAISGIISWYVNYSAPKRLRAAGPQILRHDIEFKKKEVSEQAYRIALEAAGKSDSAVLADHYRNQLQRYFAVKRSSLYRIWPSGATRRRLVAELENLDRYLDDGGRNLRRSMSEMVCQKDDLDFQSAIQNRIRFWASAHTWTLGAFLILTIAHVCSAHQFSSHW
jgi:hypothetical protein